MAKKAVIKSDKIVHLSEFDGASIPNDSKKKSNNSGGGGSNMSNYVTKEEFNATINDLAHQMELNQEKTKSNFDLLSQKLDSIATSIPDKIQISLDTKEKEDRKTAIETRRYIVGTIILSVVGIVVSLFA